MAIELGLATPAVPREPAGFDDRFCRWAALELGVRVLGTHLGGHPDELPPERARAIRARLADWGLRIVQATGYAPNMVTPDAERRRADLERLTRAGRVAADLGSPIVLAGCGSMDPTSLYGPHPDNHTPAARARLIAFLRLAAPRVADHGLTLVLEPHLLTTLDTAEHIAEVLEAVGLPAVNVDFDPVNFLGSLDAVYHSGAAMTRVFEALRPHWYPNAHAKDVAVETGFVLRITETFCGDGLLDFATLLRLADQLGPSVPVLVEHMPAFLAPRALAHLRTVARAAGVPLVDQPR